MLVDEVSPKTLNDQHKNKTLYEAHKINFITQDYNFLSIKDGIVSCKSILQSILRQSIYAKSITKCITYYI